MKTICLFLFVIIILPAFGQSDSTFYENGELKSITERFEKAVLYKSFYQNGKPCKVQISSINHILIYEEKYCENGQLLVAWNPNSEFPELVIQFDCNGAKFCESYRCRKGYRGEFKLYHSNGVIAESGEYEASDKPIGDRKTGVWKTFDRTGKLTAEISYNKGEVVYSKDFK